MSRRAWIVFAGVSALWGAPYLLIKIAVHDLSPTVIACSRTAIGAIALLPLAQRSGAVRPIRDRWRWLLLLAAVEMAVPFTLITAGERHIASSLAGILVSAAPLFVALFAIRVAPAERPRGVAVFGLVAGFAGVVVLLGAHVSGNGSEFLSAGAVLLAAALYAAAGHVLRARFADAPPIGVMSVVMALAALILAIPAAASLPSSFPSLPTCAAVLGLGVGCTGLAFLGFATLTKGGGRRPRVSGGLRRAGVRGRARCRSPIGTGVLDDLRRDGPDPRRFMGGGPPPRASRAGGSAQRLDERKRVEQQVGADLRREPGAGRNRHVDGHDPAAWVGSQRRAAPVVDRHRHAARRVGEQNRPHMG